MSKGRCMNLQDCFRPDLFSGRVVFITGGGSGINLGIARGFASLGAKIGLCGRTPEKLEAAAAELEALGAKVSRTAADVRDAESLEAALATCREELGPISTLICGAAGNFVCPAEQMSPNGFKSVVDIDLLGSFNACRLAFDQLRETRGDIQCISAGQAWQAYPAQAHVGAAKAGVDHLMRNLALEWGQYGIRCNSVAPGPIEGTEGMRRLAPVEGPVHEALNRAVPIGHYGQVDDIAAACAFLASPLAAYITGTVLVVDGGMNLPGSGAFTQILMAGMSGKL
jgi:NAD(P)-dependent dehydrogenase (short-subunit alcohol dehydrogenase family)